MTRAKRKIQAGRDYLSYATSHIKNIENSNNGRETVDAVWRRGNEAVMCLDVEKTMGGVIQAAHGYRCVSLGASWILP